MFSFTLGKKWVNFQKMLFLLIIIMHVHITWGFFHPNFFITICMTIFPILSANLDQSAHGRVNPPVWLFVAQVPFFLFMTLDLHIVDIFSLALCWLFILSIGGALTPVPSQSTLSETQAAVQPTNCSHSPVCVICWSMY